MELANGHGAHPVAGIDIQRLSPLITACILGKCRAHDWYSLRLVRLSSMISSICRLQFMLAIDIHSR